MTDELRRKLNSETAHIHWKELERHFAQGSVVTVSGTMDLVDVAARMAENQAETLKTWLEDGRVHRTTSDEALRWLESDRELWCVVVAPWVLVQEPPLDS
jgi:hypothetical protein